MKRRSIAVARGNFLKGYRGLMVQVDADGKERDVLEPCSHRHPTTHAARTCAVLRRKEK